MASPPLPALSTCKRRGPFSHRTGRTPNPLLARPPLKPEKGGTESALFSSRNEALARAAQDATLLRRARRGSLLWAAEQLQQPFPHGIKAKRDHTTYFTSVPTLSSLKSLTRCTSSFRHHKISTLSRHTLCCLQVNRQHAGGGSGDVDSWRFEAYISEIRREVSMPCARGRTDAAPRTREATQSSRGGRESERDLPSRESPLPSFLPSFLPLESTRRSLGRVQQRGTCSNPFG